jgi:iron complex outermembrane receptor protein
MMMISLSRRARLLSLLSTGGFAAFGLSTPAMAQDARDDFHGRRDAEIVVSASGLRQLDVVAGTSVIEGDVLQRNLDGQIGEVLARLPGVSATSFSPGASAPVLRGFQGARVAVLNDGLGAIDASGASADHAVAMDPLTASRIEVLRGPASLLYGSQAIGGAVNIIGKRIPIRMPDEPIHVDGRTAFDTVANLREGGLSLDMPAGESVALHLDGSWRKTGDLAVGGHVLSRNLRADLLAEAAEEPEEAEHVTELASQRGKLPDSATETWSLGGGATYLSGDSSIGFSAGYYDSRYGVPGRPGAEHHHGEEAHTAAGAEEDEVPVSIDLRSFRADMSGNLVLGGGFFSELRVRAGYTDYKHVEMEGADVGTRFFVEGGEGRVELVQAPQGEWRGSVGAQYLKKDFKAVGAEAVTPPYRTENIALFTLQEFPAGPVEVELGGRYEHTKVESREFGRSRSFNAFSGALGIARETSGGLRFGLTGSRTVRAPDGQELFAAGPHVATQQFELGDAGLKTEKAWGLEAYLRGSIGPAKVGFSAYRMWFADYIALLNTGAQENGLPIYQTMQANARYSGLEGEVTLPLHDRGGWKLNAQLQGDYIHAELTDGNPVPRIPPLSLLGALEAKTGGVDGRIEVQWFAKQDRLAAFETPTGSFAEVNASVAWHPLEGEENVTVLAQLDNIFDVAGRRHASFTKDFVPMGGRNFKLSAQFSF